MKAMHLKFGSCALCVLREDISMSFHRFQFKLYIKLFIARKS